MLWPYVSADNEYHYDYWEDWEEGEPLNAAEQHRRRVVHQVAERIHLRDTRDPFACSVDLFMGRYRIPQHLVMELAEILHPYAARRVNERAIPLPMKVSGVVNLIPIDQPFLVLLNNVVRTFLRGVTKFMLSVLFLLAQAVSY